MTKIQLYILLLAGLCVAQPAFSTTITNTDNTITITNSCLPLPTGTYDLSLTYSYDGGTPSQTFSGVSVVASGNTLVITGPGGSFPTLNNVGVSLAQTYSGTIYLTGGLGTGYIYWNADPFGNLAVDCGLVPVYIDHFTGTRSGTTINLAWDTELEQSTTVIEIYRSTPNVSGYYKIGQVAAAGNSSGTRHYTYADNTAGPSNTYYLKMLNNQGSPAKFSNTVSVSCPTCVYTPPTPVYCTTYQITGPDLCTNGQLGTYTLNTAIPNYNSITWSVDNSSVASLHTYAAYDRGQVTLRRKTAAPSSVTLTATLSGCIVGISKVVALGTPDPYITGDLVCPYVNLHINNTPDATNYAWYQMDVSTNVTQSWPSWGYNNMFDIGTGDVYAFQAQYTNSCGTSNLAFISSYWCAGCTAPPCGFDPGGFDVAISPNPSNGLVTVALPAPVEQTMARSATTTARSGKAPASPTPAAKPMIYQVKVLDMKGAVQKTFSYPGGSEKISMDLSGLSNGVYIIRVYDNKTWKTSKLVLAK